MRRAGTFTIGQLVDMYQRFSANEIAALDGTSYGNIIRDESGFLRPKYTKV
jgi:hypothetical protein